MVFNKALAAVSVNRSASSIMTIRQPPTDGDHEEREINSRTSSALIERPDGLNLSTST
jgi:hypothetical protein